VHKLVHEQSGRKAPRFKDFGITLTGVRPVVYELNKTLKDENSLAEDNDFNGGLGAYKDWLALRGDSWVLKSPDHIANLPEVMDVFPEARFLITIREASWVLASIREYWELTGIGPDYDVVRALSSLLREAKAHPDRFDWVDVCSLPGWDSTRPEAPRTTESTRINNIYGKLKGYAKHVHSDEFKERYSPKGNGASAT
jgi:hypothetical protein